MTGPELTRLAVEYLERTGWECFVMNHNKYTPRGMKGFSDIISFREGVTLLTEIKGDGDEMRPSQIKFLERIMPHLGMTLRYVKAHDIDDVVRVAEIGIGA